MSTQEAITIPEDIAVTGGAAFRTSSGLIGSVSEAASAVPQGVPLFRNAIVELLTSLPNKDEKFRFATSVIKLILWGSKSIVPRKLDIKEKKVKIKVKM